MAVIAFAEQVLTNMGTDGIISDAQETDLFLDDISDEIYGGLYLQIDTLGTITPGDVTIARSVYIAHSKPHEVFTYDGTGWLALMVLYPSTTLYPHDALYPSGYINFENYGISLSEDYVPTAGDKISITTVNTSGILNDMSGIRDSVTDLTADVFDLKKDVDDNTALRGIINKHIIIDPTIPEISVQAEPYDPEQQHYEKNEVAVFHNRVEINTGGVTAALFSKDTIKSDNIKFQNMYPQVEVNGEIVGELVWVARTNGHLSLKRGGNQ